jgi:hypothetical protein
MKDKQNILSFQIEDEVWQALKKIMLEEDDFNKSRVARRVFEIGMQEWHNQKAEKEAVTE